MAHASRCKLLPEWYNTAAAEVAHLGQFLRKPGKRLIHRTYQVIFHRLISAYNFLLHILFALREWISEETKGFAVKERTSHAQRPNTRSHATSGFCRLKLHQEYLQSLPATEWSDLRMYYANRTFYIQPLPFPQHMVHRSSEP